MTADFRGMSNRSENSGRFSRTVKSFSQPTKYVFQQRYRVLRADGTKFKTKPPE